MTMNKSRRRNIKEEYGLKFVQIPKVFFFNEHYKKLSNNAKVAYALLQDRWNLSIHNNWVDDNGDIFFLYTNQKLMEILNIGSTATLQKVKKELINAGLLEQEQRGLNMANRLYLLEPIVEEEDIYEIIEDETDEIKDLSQKEDLYEQTLTESMNTSKSLAGQGNSLSKLPFSESGSLDNERLDVQKLNTNDTDFSNTNKDFKDNKDWKNQNDLLISGIENNLDIESSKELIDEFIENKGIEQMYGKPIIQNFLKYSKYDFVTFKTFYDKLFFAHRAIEEELGFFFALDEPFTFYGEEHQLELSKAFWRAIQRYKTNKIKKDFNNYLFGVFKGTLQGISLDIQSEKTSKEQNNGSNKVPMYNIGTGKYIDEN